MNPPVFIGPCFIVGFMRERKTRRKRIGTALVRIRFSHAPALCADRLAWRGDGFATQ
jgi:hypothetical protein